MVQLDPFYNIRFEDGTVFHYNGDRDALISRVREFSPVDVKGYERFREKAWDIFTQSTARSAKPTMSAGRHHHRSARTSGR